ncbi:MAG: DMT family transporter [Saprospiraceae bacterium]|nr:DMT family transporter [Saprospiraceae bacterium]
MFKMGQESLGILLALVGSLLFSTKAVFVKLSYVYEVDSISLLLLRMVFALPFYLMALIFRRTILIEKCRNTPWKYWLGLILAASLGYYLSSFLDFLGLKYIDASVERLILFIYPTFIALLSFLLFRHRISRLQWLALCMSYLGLIAVFGVHLSEISIDNQFWKGVILILLCALSFALFLVLSQWLILHFGVSIFTSLSMSIACFFVIGHFTYRHGWHGISDYSAPVYWYAFAMATMATVLPSYIVNYAIKQIGALRAAIVASVGPISTITLAYLLLGERLDWWQLAGAILIITGVTMVSIEMKKSNA